MALLVALGLLLVLTVSSTAVYTFATSNQNASLRTRSDFSALQVARAGVDEAVSVLAAGDALNPYTLHPQGSYVPSPNQCANPPLNPAEPAIGNACAPLAFSLSAGTATVWGWLSASYLWSITSIGAAAAPDGRTDLRTVTASVQVVPGQGSFNTTTWNYAISAGTSNATTCDTTVSNSAEIDMPLYVQGNLCMSNIASVQQDSRPVQLVVGGKLALTNAAFVGTTSQPIAAAHLVGGCTPDIGVAGHACSAADNVHAQVLDQVLPTIPIPTADYPTAYQNASPGPLHPCTVVSGSPPVWDNDGKLDLANHPNGSVGPVFNLTPAQSYTCETSSGKLDWNASTHQLTIAGLMYIDGSVQMSNNATATYVGKGTLYLSGTFSIANSAKLCATASCDYTQWAPDSTMFLVVAHGAAGVTFANNTQFQGAVYADGPVDIANHAELDGPLLGHPLELSNNIELNPLPPLNAPPLDAPTTPNTHVSIGLPIYGGG